MAAAEDLNFGIMVEEHEQEFIVRPLEQGSMEERREREEWVASIVLEPVNTAVQPL